MATDRKVYKLEEVAKHNKLEDCWLVLYGKVYNVTEFVDDHPGGGDLLVSSTGKDATEDFEDVGHSKAAKEQLDKFYVGEMDESTLTNKRKYTVPPQQQKQNSQGGGGDFIIKFLQFIVPLVILAVAVVVKNYTKKQPDTSSSP